ncbi:MAG: chromosomal replication initiator protein DnaA [Planctomycetes bacterium]|nr:chromosomal replication initiator protein DnaA [Planctomycetota bacterium]
MTATLTASWPAVLARLRSGGNEKAVAIWLDPAKVRPVGLDSGELVLECPNPLYRATIQKRLEAPLLASLVEGGSPATSVRYVISGPALREHERRKDEAAAEAAVEPGPVAAARPRGWGHGYKLLEHFVVGTANRMAFDAVQQVLDNPRGTANPLFIHGKSGLGKTHLEQGLALAFKERYPRAKVTYVRCEQFTNEYIEAAKSGTLHAFRVRMRHPDLLLIDDLHFLSEGTKDRTQKELFATFNEMAEQGKQVVFTSDASPRAIQYLEESFVQRFAGGLVVELQRPDQRLRADVVQAKATTHELTLPDEVVSFVVDHFTDNIRELEGAVNKLSQFARSFQRRVDLAAARQALADLVGRGGEESVQDMVLREVGDRFGIAPRELVGRKRTGSIPHARHVAMYLLKLAGDEGYERVGRVFGIGHTGVIYACKEVTRRRAEDSELDRFVTDVLLRSKRG